MKTRKKPDIINLLESFSSKELRRFNSFLLSPYYNTDNELIGLSKILQKEVLFKESFDEESKSKLYCYMTKGKKTKMDKETSLRLKMSKLLKLAQEFLQAEGLAEDPIIKTQLLIKKILEKEQLNLYERLAKKQQKEVDKQEVKGIADFNFAFQVEMDKMNFLHQKGLLVKTDNFPALHATLDLYYLINKLKLFCTMHSILNVRANKSYDFSSQEAIDSLLTNPVYSNYSIVIFYNTVIQLMKTGEEASYDILVGLLKKENRGISKNDLVGFYHAALNFCIGKVREGKTSYYTNIFNLYKAMDKEEILMDKDFIDFIKLKNIIAASCREGDFKWATALVHKYCPYISIKVRESLKNLYLGVIAFYQAKYSKAKDYLHEAEKEKVNSFILLNCKILLAKNYYESDQQYGYGTYRRFRSIEKFIQDNKEITSESKAGYKNFMKILINIYRFRFGEGKQKLESIRSTLEQMKLVSDKKWLLEKMDELV